MKKLFSQSRLLFPPSKCLFPKKKALLIGINYVESTDGRLRGCVNDVNDMSDFLKKRGYVTEVYHDEDPDLRPGTTYAGIIKNIQKLVQASWKENLEAVYIHYSGHGSYVRDTDGDEADGYDECICPSDMDESGVILDDKLHVLMNAFNPKTRVVVVFDCCHSGTCLDLPYTFKTASDIPDLTKPKLKNNITLISGCRDNQTSADAYIGDKFSGALTKTMLDVLTGNPNISAVYLLECIHYRLAEKGFTQLPMISSSRTLLNIKLF